MDVNLGMLISNGEETKLEYKRTLAFSGKFGQAELVKDLLAMVNAHGSEPGYLLIGVDEKTRDLFDTASLALDDGTLHTFLNEYTDPPVPFSFVSRVHEGVTLGVIEVAPSPDRFHLVKKDLRDSEKFLLTQGETWIRSGATRRRLTAWDMKRLKDDHASQFQAPQPHLVVTFASRETEIVQDVVWISTGPAPIIPTLGRTAETSAVKIELCIYNTGTVGADKVHVKIALPVGCKSVRPYINYLIAPNIKQEWNLKREWHLWAHEDITISGPNITHGLGHCSEIAFLHFDDPAKTHTLKWQARAANMVKPTEGILTITPREEPPSVAKGPTIAEIMKAMRTSAEGAE